MLANRVGSHSLLLGISANTSHCGLHLLQMCEKLIGTMPLREEAAALKRSRDEARERAQDLKCKVDDFAKQLETHREGYETWTSATALQVSLRRRTAAVHAIAARTLGGVLSTAQGQKKDLGDRQKELTKALKEANKEATAVQRKMELMSSQRDDVVLELERLCSDLAEAELGVKQWEGEKIGHTCNAASQQ